MSEEIGRWHAELGWLGAGEVQAGVLIEAAGPVLRTVTPGVAASALPPGTPRLAGLTLPGLANAHSHAFHRALRGVTERARARSGPGGSGCTRSPRGSPRTATWRWPGPSTPRWRWPG